MFNHLTVYAGCMFSGKSTELMNRYEECADSSKILYKYTFGNTGFKGITTHNGKTMMGHLIRPGDKLNSKYRNYFIDEIQFATEIDTVLYDQNVWVAALDLDFEGKPFTLVGDLLCMADDIKKCHGYCPKGSITSFSLRTSKSTDRYSEDNEYLPVCHRCFKEKKAVCYTTGTS